MNHGQTISHHIRACEHPHQMMITPEHNRIRVYERVQEGRSSRSPSNGLPGVNLGLPAAYSLLTRSDSSSNAGGKQRSTFATFSTLFAVSALLCTKLWNIACLQSSHDGRLFVGSGCHSEAPSCPLETSTANSALCGTSNSHCADMPQSLPWQARAALAVRMTLLCKLCQYANTQRICQYTNTRSM